MDDELFDDIVLLDDAAVALVEPLVEVVSEPRAAPLSDDELRAAFGIPADVLTPLVQIGNEQAFTPDEVVYLGVKHLAGRCDGARQLDNVGYNRLDAAFGHKLAETPFREWSDRQIWSARKMLERYKNTQLSFLWPKMPALTADPPMPAWQQREIARRNDEARRADPTFVPSQTMRTLTVRERNGGFVLVFEQSYDRALIDEIRALPGRVYIPEERIWTVPLTMESLEPAVELAAEHGYSIEPNVVQALDQIIAHYQDTIQLSHAGSIEQFDVALPAGLKLYPFQEAGVTYLNRVGNALCADEMGLGKTVQGLVAVQAQDHFPLIVVCPAALKLNWAREARKWLPGKRITVLDGKLRPLTAFDGSPYYDVAIINYNSKVLGKWIPDLITFAPKAIIFDEIHNAKNPKAQQSKLCEDLAKYTGARRIGLSGTPVVNRPRDFWQVIKLLGYDKIIGGSKTYHERFDTKDPRRLHELNHWARSNFMIRRRKEDVLTELPPKMMATEYLELDNRVAYDSAEADIAGYFAAKKVEDAEFLRGIEYIATNMKLAGREREFFIKHCKEQHFTNAYLIAAQSEQLLRWEALKQLAVAGKMSAAFDWIDAFLESEEKLIVFCSHTEIGHRLADRYGANFIHGGVDVQTRQRYVDDFQSPTGKQVIVGNIIAMGEGITLTAASNVAFLEFGWNPMRMDQAADRAHRIGQRDVVTVHYLVAEDTIDEEIVALIEEKRVMTDAIQDGESIDNQRVFFAQLEQRLADRLAKKQRPAP